MTWPALFDRRWFALVIVAAWALAYLPHLGTRDLRLEEGRRATPAREMLDSGDFICPTLYGDTYLNKPPLYFWLVSACGAGLGDVTPLATRLPSVLAALGCALVALRFAPDILDRPTRSLAALFVLSAAALLDKGTLGEIDAPLALVVALALKIWWDGNRPTGQTFRSWLAVGCLLGIAGLLKGPEGPAIFYLTAIPFLVWQRRSARLLTVGHGLCLVLSFLPVAAWVAVLMTREAISSPELIGIWTHQLGAGSGPGAVLDPDGRTAHAVAHFFAFPLHVLGMFFPGVLWLGFGLRRRWATAHGVSEDLRRFLVCGVLGPCLAFYLYPESRPRHVLPAFFPAAVLGAAVVAGVSRMSAGRGPSRLATGIALIPLIAGAAGLVLALAAWPDGVPGAAGVFVACAAWSWAAVRLTRRTQSSSALAANIAGGALSAWFVANAVVFPCRAPQAPTRVALRDLGGRLPPGEVVYTTRTFPVTGEGYYNLQFHLARRLRAADLPTLRHAAPCVGVVTPAERAELESEGWVVEEVSRLVARGGAPEVHVIRLGRRPGG